MLSHPGILYVRIDIDDLYVRNVDSDHVVQRKARPGFTTRRLLVGEFLIAQTLLRSMVGEFRGRWFSRSPMMLMHPLAMVDEGLCEVEHRVLTELAQSAGASSSLIWMGHVLSNEQAREVALSKVAKQP